MWWKHRHLAFNWQLNSIITEIGRHRDPISLGETPYFLSRKSRAGSCNEECGVFSRVPRQTQTAPRFYRDRGPLVIEYAVQWASLKCIVYWLPNECIGGDIGNMLPRARHSFANEFMAGINLGLCVCVCVITNIELIRWYFFKYYANVIRKVQNESVWLWAALPRASVSALRNGECPRMELIIVQTTVYDSQQPDHRFCVNYFKSVLHGLMLPEISISHRSFAWLEPNVFVLRLLKLLTNNLILLTYKAACVCDLLSAQILKVLSNLMQVPEMGMISVQTPRNMNDGMLSYDHLSLDHTEQMKLKDVFFYIYIYIRFSWRFYPKRLTVDYTKQEKYPVEQRRVKGLAQGPNSCPNQGSNHRPCGFKSSSLTTMLQSALPAFLSTVNLLLLDIFRHSLIGY